MNSVDDGRIALAARPFKTKTWCTCTPFPITPSVILLDCFVSWTSLDHVHHVLTLHALIYYPDSWT